MSIVYERTAGPSGPVAGKGDMELTREMERAWMEDSCRADKYAVRIKELEDAAVQMAETFASQLAEAKSQSDEWKSIAAGWKAQFEKANKPIRVVYGFDGATNGPIVAALS